MPDYDVRIAIHLMTAALERLPPAGHREAIGRLTQAIELTTRTIPNGGAAAVDLELAALLVGIPLSARDLVLGSETAAPSGPFPAVIDRAA